MLQFIFSKPVGGKTYTAIQKIKELVSMQKKCVLIVPEQFTFETEKAIIKSLGNKNSLNVEVLSFTRLCDEIGRISGGIAGKILSDCDKVILMKQALNTVKDDLKLWKAFTNSVSFSKTLLDIIGEFKINAISFKELLDFSENTNNSTLSAKLKDIAIIYESYDLLLAEKFIDPADNLTKLYNNLENYKYFSDKNVFLDSFKGFTGQQYKIIDRILEQSENVFISFTNNPQNTREFNVYSNIRKASDKITAIAKKYGVHICEPLILTHCGYKNKGLSDLEELISGESVENISDDGSVNICVAATIADEAEFAARKIRQLVRTQNYRYRDFVIIVRDEKIYKEQVEFSCKRNDINCFYDNRVPLSSFPLATAVKEAINAISLSSESLFNFHKTGLGLLSYEEISELENYVFLWNIDGSMWLNDWDMNPNGLTDLEDKTDKTEEFLIEINTIRKKAISPILKFKEEFNGSAKDLATAVFNLLERCKVSEKLLAMSEKLCNSNNEYSSDVLKLSFEEYIKILDSIVSCYGEKRITKEEFIETLNLAVSLSEVGVIPQTLDQVTFGSADRIRPSRPKIAFILGANQGLFPKNVQNSGVFNITERRNLIESGFEISDNSLYSAIDEEYLVYCNLCCASEKLFISFTQQSSAGQAMEPSSFINTILNHSEIKLLSEPDINLNYENLPESSASAISEYARRFHNKNETLAIKTALQDKEILKKINAINDFAEHKPKTLTAATAKKLFGENIRMSASKFDTYNRCHFSYFCRYGVSAQKLQAADFDVMQRGTIVHYVLERFINDYKDELSVDLITKTDEITSNYINEYFDNIKGFRSIKNSKVAFLISRISRSLKEVVKHITLELLQSDFKPVACELKIGENGSLKFPFSNGNIVINGSIDRVDEYNGYIRIIDYKTGSKSFKLPDVLFGLNMQMLIYLYSVTRAKGIDDANAAGILYQPSKRDTNDSGLAMNGLLQSDKSLIDAMDKSGTGEFVPRLLLNNDGTVSKRCNSFIEPIKFAEIFDYIEKIMQKTGDSIISGDISVSPLDGRESPACKYCDYYAVCGIENAEIKKVPELKNQEVFDLMKGDQNNGI